MTLVRRLVLGAGALVLLTYFLVPNAAQASRSERFGGLALALLIAFALTFLAAQLFVGRIGALTADVRNVGRGNAPRFTQVGIPEIDALGEALRQMHADVGTRFELLRGEQRDSTAIIAAMVEGVIAADARGRITTANPAARRLLGYDESADLPELRALFRAKSARAAVDEVLAGEFVRDREFDMEELTLMLNARPLDDRGVVLVLHDLTTIRRLESVRRDFVANASHELKTPLTSIAGYAETLVGDTGEMDEGTRHRFLATILSNARRMQHLVDDLLDLSRIESGRWIPVRAPLELAPLAKDCWQLVMSKTEPRGIRLVEAIATDSTTLHADPETVRQVLSNLFDNAIRYVPDGGTVTIRSEHHDGGTLLSVEDNGSGIAAEHLPRIFERFYRVDPSRSREEGGTGLGLAIVKHMVETEGGRVWAESTLREGTSIRCWFKDG